MSIRVAILTVYPYDRVDEYRGGVMQATFHLIRGLSFEEGLEVCVIAPTSRVRTTEHRVVNPSLGIYYIPQAHPGYGSIVFYRGLRKAVSELLRQLRPDVIHAIGVPAYSFVAIKSTIPHVLTVHGILRNELRVHKENRSLLDYVRDMLTVWYERYSFRRMKNLIAISSQIETEVTSVNREVTICRVGNCIDEAFFAVSQPHFRPRVLFVGGLAHRKGVHVLLEAFETVLTRIEDAELHIAGITVDGDYCHHLENRFGELLRRDGVSLLGEVSNEMLVNEVEQCSILCLPSLAESVPLVISQAMAAGRVVVASRVGGIPDMIVDGVSGRLCEVNDVDGLSRLLVELLRDDEQMNRIGKKAREVAKGRYRSEQVAGKTYAFYQQIVERESIGATRA